jgi:hypothetical protein
LSKHYIDGETKEYRKLRKLKEKQASPVFVDDIQRDPNLAFVIGNGLSRQGLNLDLLKSQGTVYACNAIYRDGFLPDYLIAVDTKMIREITSVGYHLEHEVYTNPNRYTRSLDRVRTFNPNLGWSSGPSALHLASQMGHKQIYILGFDYEGTGPEKSRVNNIFAGTQNYKGLDDKATFFGNWTRQTMLCVQRFSKCSYYRVIPEVNSFVPDNLREVSNLNHITIDNFKKMFKL